MGVLVQFVGRLNFLCPRRVPLVVGIKYRRAPILEEKCYNLYLPEESSWRYRNYEFNLIRYEYQQSMVLAVRSLKLRAL